MKVVHLTTVDLSLRYLVFSQMLAVRDVGGEALHHLAWQNWQTNEVVDLRGLSENDVREARRTVSANSDGSAAALFLMSTPSSGQWSPLATWITAAGWASATEQKLGRSWLLTPNGLLTADQARDLATSGRSGQRVSSRSQHLPLLRTFAKDVRAAYRSREFRRLAAKGPWNNEPLTFVWQHHDLFQTAGFDVAQRAGCPLVLFVDAPVVWESAKWGVRRPGWGNLLAYFGERPQLSQADVVACVSEEVAVAVQNFGVPPERILVTPCAVDIDRFSPSVNGAPVRRKLGLGDRFVIGWLGGFHGFHDVELIVRAASALSVDYPDVALLLVGDGAQRPEIERLAARLKIKAVLFTGAVSHSEVPEYLAAMDVATIASADRQGFHYSPLKLREYMAAGKPVVAPRVGQIERWLEDGVDALMVEPDSVDAMVVALECLHNDVGLRTAIGLAARAKAEREGSWGHQVNRLLAVIRHSADELGPV